MTAAERLQRTEEADDLCVQAFAKAGCPDAGVALVAVGGFGRRELAPFSDLDVVLIHDEDVELGEWASQLWYPLWDSGQQIDHAVRTLAQAAEQASADLRVALGLLDARHLAGDPNLTLRLRTALLNQWRRDARSRLGELHTLVTGRAALLGELAHSSIPDLKESAGGLRDATVLNALVATWLVDVPHAELERARTGLLDVRDVLHRVAGRATDRVVPEFWPDIAEAMDFPDATTLQKQTRAWGRRITHISRLTWNRAAAVLQRPTSRGVRRPSLAPAARGVAISNGEVVLAAGARLADDPCLLLRAAAVAAERDLVLAPTTASRCVAEGVPLPDPWPEEARELMVRLLAAGAGLLNVWETLDETEAIAMILPEWEQVRLLPHASVVHRFTVDRHMVETCIEAAKLIRQVERPDVLMVAALLHDIGKGQLVEHCVAGAPIARAVATRMGYDDREVDLIGELVRWHLLLPETATSRDLDDPATVATVIGTIPDRELLELLVVLTEADARATSEKAWTSWRSRLILGLFRRAAAELDEEGAPVVSDDRSVEIPPAVLADPTRVAVQAIAGELADEATITVVSGDRVGLLADAAAMLAMARVSVRAARAWAVDDIAISEWQISGAAPDAAVLRERLEGIVEGRIDAGERLARRTPAKLEPRVAIRPEASNRSTVIEVRTEDKPGVIYAVCSALASLGLSVQSAHVSTVGPQARDVFYVRETSAGVLSDERAAEAAHAVRAALG